MNKYYSVEQISELLTIHPKTIQRYIREGKLNASKIGKSWRITGHDLSLFIDNEKSAYAGNEPNEKHPVADRFRSSAVVDITVYDREEAIYIMNSVTGELHLKPAEFGSSSMNAQYIIEENKVRITLWGGIQFMEVMMGSLSALAQQFENTERIK